MSDVRCPDEGACHHDCHDGGACWRVLNTLPLSGVYRGDAWPRPTVSLHELKTRRLTKDAWRLWRDEDGIPSLVIFCHHDHLGLSGECDESEGIFAVYRQSESDYGGVGVCKAHASPVIWESRRLAHLENVDQANRDLERQARQ